MAGQGYHDHSDEHAKTGSQSMGNQNASKNLTADDDRSKGGKASASTNNMNNFSQQGGDGHQHTGEKRTREDH